MANIRRTAMGDQVDMDMLRLANETVIAVGNAKTNARGDELGPGGKIVKTRAKIMQEYHKLNAATAQHDEPIAESVATASLATADETPVVNAPVAQPVAKDEPIAESTYVKPRGSFADAIAKETEVSQELLDPVAILGTKTGIQRI